MSQAESSPLASPWPHRLAVLLCCATFPLIWIGGLVTTYRAGMAVPDWPNTYGYNLFFYPWLDWLRGPWDLFVEHGHRLWASMVGLITLAFAASVFLTKQRKSLKLLALIAVASVIAQGVLGGMRVEFDARTLAKIHGCVGPAFFALTAALTVVTSPRWQQRETTSGMPVLHSSLLALSIITPLLAYGQLMLGAQVRHVAPDESHSVFRAFVLFHVLIGLGLSAQIFALTWRAWSLSPAKSFLRRYTAVLSLLIVLQVLLGAATWVYKYHWPALVAEADIASTFTLQAYSWRQAQITTAHVAVGSLIVAVSTALAVRVWGRWEVRSIPFRQSARLMGAAA